MGHKEAERPGKPDLRIVPGSVETIPERLTKSPFVDAIRDAGPEKVKPEELRVFVSKMATALKGVDSTKRDEILGAITDSQTGASLGFSFVQAMNTLGAEMGDFKTGSAVHSMETIAARSPEAEGKMERIGQVLSGMTLKQTTAVLEEIQKNPTGCDPFTIVASITAAREEVEETGGAEEKVA